VAGAVPWQSGVGLGDGDGGGRGGGDARGGRGAAGQGALHGGQRKEVRCQVTLRVREGLHFVPYSFLDYIWDVWCMLCLPC